MSTSSHDLNADRPAISHRDALLLTDVLSRQSELNGSVCRALEAVALTADRYDAEITELRDEICSLGNRIESLTRLVLRVSNGAGIDTGDHSRRVGA